MRELYSEANTDLQLYVEDTALTKSESLKLKLDASNFLSSTTEYPVSIRLSTYMSNGPTDKWLGNINKTIINAKHAENLSYELDLFDEMNYPEEDLRFKFYNEEGVELAEFNYQAYTNEFITRDREEEFDCIDESQISCQFERLLQNLDVKLVEKKKIETSLTKTSNDSYQLSIPALSSKMFAKKKSPRIRMKRKWRKKKKKWIDRVLEDDNSEKTTVTQTIAPLSATTRFVRSNDSSVNAQHEYKPDKCSFVAADIDSFSDLDLGRGSAVFGKNTMARADYSFVTGQDNTVGGRYSAAFGKSNSNEGSYSMVTGADSSNQGSYNLITGRLNQAGTFSAGSFVAGYNNRVNGNYSILLGRGNVVNGYTSTAIGSHLTIEGSNTTVIGSGQPGNNFVTEENNAFIVVHDGQIVMQVRGNQPEFPNGVIINGSTSNGGGGGGGGSLNADDIIGSISPTKGGTGVSNTGSFSWGSSDIDIYGGYDLIFRLTGDTDLTLPTTGTLATESYVTTLINSSISNGGGSGSSVDVAGSAGQIQYNNGNGLAASANLTFNDTKNTLLAKAIAFKEVISNSANTTVAIDWTTGNQQVVDLVTNAVTLSVSEDPAGPCTVLLQLNHNANIGTKSINWPVNFMFSEGLSPSLSTQANAVDFVSCFYNPDHGASGTYFCQASYNFF